MIGGAPLATAGSRARRPRRWVLLSGVLAVAVAAGLFSARPADPSRVDPAARAEIVATFQRRLVAPELALRALAARLDAALVAGRSASARILGGEADPGIAFADTAAAWRAAEPVASAAVRLLDSARQPAICPRSAELPSVDVAAFSEAASALATAGDRASTLFTMRRASERTLEALGETLAALERGEDPSALDHSRDARAHLDEVVAAYAGFEGVMPTASIWIETAGRLVDEARAMAEARSAGDATGAQQAAAAYEAAAADAPLADRALSVALSEGSAEVTGPPLARAGEVATAIADGAALVRSLADDGACR